MDHPITSRLATRLRWFGCTHVGKVRKVNEDAFVGLRFDGREVHHLDPQGEIATENADFAFAVSDGLGGAQAGEYASRVTVEQITALLPRSFRQGAIRFGPGFEDVMSELFDHVHGALVHLGAELTECHGMEATLSLCWITPQWAYFGHIGDSRIYYLPAGAGPIKQLTADDTHVGWLLRQGQINEREARNHPRRRMLQKALGGSNQFVEPQIGAVGYAPGDRFLLCTDGLVEGLYDADLLDHLRHDGGGNIAERMVTDSVERDGRDNVTAIVIEAI